MKTLKHSILLVMPVLLLTVIAGCKKEQDDKKDKTVACFTPSSTTALTGEEITFTNCSENGTDFEWDYGDNIGSTQSLAGQNPTYKYSGSGSFTVKLKATGPYGVDSVTKNITVTGTNAPSVAGVYTGSETCTSTNDNYSITISTTGTSIHRIYIQNIYNSNVNVYTDITGFAFQIPSQAVGTSGVTISGSGTFNNNTVTINFTITDNNVTEVCEYIATKQ